MMERERIALSNRDLLQRAGAPPARTGGLRPTSGCRSPPRCARRPTSTPCAPPLQSAAARPVHGWTPPRSTCRQRRRAPRCHRRASDVARVRLARRRLASGSPRRPRGPRYPRRAAPLSSLDGVRRDRLQRARRDFRAGPVGSRFTIEGRLAVDGDGHPRAGFLRSTCVEVTRRYDADIGVGREAAAILTRKPWSGAASSPRPLAVGCRPAYPRHPLPPRRQRAAFVRGDEQQRCRPPQGGSWVDHYGPEVRHRARPLQDRRPRAARTTSGSLAARADGRGQAPRGPTVDRG